MELRTHIDRRSPRRGVTRVTIGAIHGAGAGAQGVLQLRAGLDGIVASRMAHVFVYTVPPRAYRRKYTYTLLRGRSNHSTAPS